MGLSVALKCVFRGDSCWMKLAFYLCGAGRGSSEWRPTEKTIKSLLFALFPVSFSFLSLPFFFFLPLRPTAIFIWSFFHPLRDHLRGNKVVFRRSDLYPSLRGDWHVSQKDEGMSAEYFRGEERESDIKKWVRGREGGMSLWADLIPFSVTPSTIIIPGTSVVELWNLGACFRPCITLFLCYIQK